MPKTFERPAPPAPEQRPSDDELHRIVYGADFVNNGSPDEPDEITYKHPAGNWTTTRDERARASRIWQEEQQVPYPDNAAENLRRTERMLRLRLAHMSPAEFTAAVPDTITVHNERLRHIGELARQHAEPEQTSWQTDRTGNFVQHQAEPAPERPGYTGRHRRRGIRIPLHRLIRRHKPHTPAQ